MLKQNNQLELNFSKYTELYDIIIKPDNFWRQLSDMVDFSFVYEELKDKYSSTMGRTCEDVVRMFKYLLLKQYYDNKSAYKDFLKLIGKMCKKTKSSKYFSNHRIEDNRMIHDNLCK